MMSQSYQNYGRPNKKTGPCDCCVRAVKWIPVLFIFSIICWSYYAFVVQLCFMTVENIAEKIILLLLYHVFCFLFLWSYYQTIFVDIALVPPEFRLKSTEVQKIYTAESEVEQREILEQYSRNLPITNRTISGAVRFCDKCCIIKPDRAHHCSVCGDCVLKMDHHCPWVNNCVNFSNYKFFILFLGYALLYCIYIALASLPYFIQFWKGHLEGMGRFHILFLFFVSVMFAISLVSLFGYHIYLVLMNRTTLEAFRAPIFRIGGPDKHGFSLGHLNNFQEVFGDDKRYWFLPIFTSLGNGVSFPCQSHHQQPPNYESMGATTTTPNGHSSTIINMNNFSATSQSSNSSMNNNHSNNSFISIKTDTRLAQLPTSKLNSVAPMSDHPQEDTVIISNEKSSKTEAVEHTIPASDDEKKFFVKRSDKDATISVNGYSENGSNTHLLNHNSETMNI